MPIATDPEATFKIVLESDKAKPEAEQPRFIYHYLTARQWEQVTDVMSKLETFKNKEVMDKIFDACRVGLVGWENMMDLAGKPIVFRAEALEDILTLAEATELLVTSSASTLSVDSKKKLKLPSGSGSGRSAKTARAKKRAKTRRHK